MNPHPTPATAAWSPYDHPALADKFRPIFQRIADTVLERERTRTLPHEPITWLKQAGFGAVRVPVEHGGGGASIPQLFQLLIELSEADSNVTQALRGHFAFVEDRLNAPASPQRDVWLKRFVAGELVGNAWSEVGSAPKALARRFLAAALKGGTWPSGGSITMEVRIWPSTIVKFVPWLSQRRL